MVLRTGKEYQTYLAGQAGWQEKMPNHDADAILRPLLNIMCRQDLSGSESKNLCYDIARKTRGILEIGSEHPIEIKTRIRSNLQGGDSAEEEVGRRLCRGASGHVEEKS